MKLHLFNDDRGSLDLTRQIEELNIKVKNLDGLEKIHKKQMEI